MNYRQWVVDVILVQTPSRSRRTSTQYREPSTEFKKNLTSLGTRY